MKNSALTFLGFIISLFATLFIYLKVPTPPEYQLIGAILLTMTNILTWGIIMVRYVPTAEAARTNKYLKQQHTVTVCHRGTRKIIDKKLQEGYLKAHPIKNSARMIDRFLDGETKGTWVSCGLPGKYNSFRTGSHIFNGWNKAIVFDIDSTKLDTPKGWKRSTGKSQLIIREDFQFPPETKIRIFERKYLFCWLEVGIFISSGLTVSADSMALVATATPA